LTGIAIARRTTSILWGPFWGPFCFYVTKSGLLPMAYTKNMGPLLAPFIFKGIVVSSAVPFFATFLDIAEIVPLRIALCSFPVCCLRAIQSVPITEVWRGAKDVQAENRPKGIERSFAATVKGNERHDQFVADSKLSIREAGKRPNPRHRQRFNSRDVRVAPCES
jgi:hypothetical protein